MLAQPSAAEYRKTGKLVSDVAGRADTGLQTWVQTVISSVTSWMTFQMIRDLTIEPAMLVNAFKPSTQRQRQVDCRDRDTSQANL